MATQQNTRSSITQTHDVRPAPGALNPALGRTSRDLATDQPAGFGPQPDVETDPDSLSSRDNTTGSGQQLPPEARKVNPDRSPDERLGLHPTIAGDAAPDAPLDLTRYGG
jgi:hypothetical protein